MGLGSWIHLRPRVGKYDITPDMLKQLMDDVSEKNELYRAILGMLSPGQSLAKDYSLKEYIKSGYEGNPDVFSITSRIAGMFGGVRLKVTKEGEDVEDSPLVERIFQPNNYQIINEFLQLWETFYLMTGNAIIYAPRYEGGNNKGQIMTDGMYIVPTQHVDISGQSWRNPVDYYTLDLDPGESVKISASNIIHNRMPNLQFAEGSNFMGMSPLKVAAAVIEMENQGYNIIANTLQRGIPPGILSKAVNEYDSHMNEEQQADMERAYMKKYGSQNKTNRAGVPIVTLGDIRWTQIGFSNFRDLMILENSQHGLRVLCNILGVPSIVFNDTSGSTFSNQKEARRAIYTNRIIPDMDMLLSYLNVQLSEAYGGEIIEADYSDIPELQEAKKDQAEWMNIAIQAGCMSRNEFRERMGLGRIEAPGMDEFFVPFNLVPIGDVGSPTINIDEAEKILKNYNIEDYNLLKKV